MGPINPKEVKPYSEIRSEQDSNILWLENFRLNLTDSSSTFSYSISEVEYGLETIYNLIGSVGPNLTSNSNIYNDSIELEVNNGQLSGERIKSLSSDIFSMIEGYVFQEDKGFLFVDLNAEEMGNKVKFLISTTAADISDPDTSSTFTPYCTEDYFTSSQCFRSAIGNPKIGYSILNGGPCNDPNNETSAQAEVEAAIQNEIPQVIYHKLWSTLPVAWVRYTNPVHIPLYLPVDLDDIIYNYPNCGSLNLFYLDQTTLLDEIEYGFDELNCTLCLLYDYIESIRPNGKELCDITIYGDAIPDGILTFIHWLEEVVFCDVEEVSLSAPLPHQTPTSNPNENDFLGVLSLIHLFENH